MEEAEERFSKLKRMAAIRDVRHELEPYLEVEALAPRVRKVFERLEQGEDPSALEVEIKDIKREYKEEYFLSQLTDTLVSAKPMEVKRAPILKAVADTPLAEKKSMEVEDLFLLSKRDYRLIHHVTNREITEEEKKEVFKELKAVRSFIRHSGQFKPGELNIIKFEDKISLIQDGQTAMLAMVVKGDVNIWAKKLMNKVLGMIEKEEGDVLRTWDGDPSKVPVSKKNMTALMYACMRLGNKQNPQKPSQ